MATDLGRFHFHGDRMVGRVNDCSTRRQETRVVADDLGFVQRFRAVCDEICVLLARRPQMTAAQDNKQHRNALAELNKKNAEFWSRQ